MEIRLTTREATTLDRLNRAGMGRGRVSVFPQKSFPKSHLKALNDAGLIEVSTVTRSPWKGTTTRLLRDDTYEIVVTDFGRQQLVRHRP